MLILLEGCDRSGKSTLAEELADITGGEVIHRGKPECHPLEEYESFLEDYVPGSGQTLILDRWHVGERVWPGVFNRQSAYDLPMFRHTEMYLRSRGACLIYAARDDKRAWSAELKQFEEPIHGKSLTKALKLYDEALAERYPNEWWYDFTVEKGRGRQQWLTDFLAFALREESTAAKMYDVTREWVGNPQPQVMLVGEQVGLGPLLEKYPNAPRVPFVPYKETSGHFMLNELGDEWRDVAIVNSHRRDGTPESLEAMWERLGYPEIVALGKIAFARARDAFDDVAEVLSIPHPQFVRRFKRAEGPGWYRDQLLQALEL